MVFLFLARHSATCVDHDIALDPLQYIATQTEIVIRGLSLQPPALPHAT
jgi:hypothetical protein